VGIETFLAVPAYHMCQQECIVSHDPHKTHRRPTCHLCSIASHRQAQLKVELLPYFALQNLALSSPPPLLTTLPCPTQMSSRHSEGRRCPCATETRASWKWTPGKAGASSRLGAVDVKLDVAKDETIARGNEGRKIALMMNPQVMPPSLISRSIGSSKVASSSKHVAKRSRKKKRQCCCNWIRRRWLSCVL
jgi:hypothetical protein